MKKVTICLSILMLIMSLNIIGHVWAEDISPIIIESIYPQEGATVAGKIFPSAMVTFNTSIDLGVYGYIDFYIDGVKQNTQTAKVRNNTYTYYSYETSTVSPGTHQFSITARAKVGGATLTQNSSFIINNTPDLTVNYTQPEGGEAGNIDIAVSATFHNTKDSGTNQYGRVGLYFGDTKVDESIVRQESSDFNLVYDTSSLPVGNYNFEVKATTAQGTYTTVQPINNVYVDNRPTLQPEYQLIADEHSNHKIYITGLVAFGNEPMVPGLVGPYYGRVLITGNIGGTGEIMLLDQPYETRPYGTYGTSFVDAHHGYPLKQGHSVSITVSVIPYGADASVVVSNTQTFALNQGPTAEEQKQNENLGENQDKVTVAEPISVYTGNLIITVKDMEIPGVNIFPSSFKRSYNSQSTEETSLGYGWTNNFNSCLKDYGSKVAYIATDGRWIFFVKNDDGSFTPAKGDYLSLEKSENSDETYVITELLGTKYSFDANGKLLKIQDTNGNEVVLIYNESNLLTKITYPFDVELNLTYNAQNLLSSVVDQQEREVKYAYNENNDLISVTSVLGAQTSYTYDENHNLLSETDPSGDSISQTYDTQDRVLTQTDFAGGIWQFIYDVENHNTQVINPRGFSNTYFFNEAGYVIKEIDALGGEILQQWDDNYNLTQVTNPLGYSTNMTYNQYGQLLSIIDAENNVTTLTYDSECHKIQSVTDANGNIYGFTYDSKGNLIESKNPLNYIATYTYNGYGQISQASDYNGHTYQMSYNSHGFLNSLVDPLGGEEKYTHDDVGNVLTYIDKRNQQTSFEYNARNQVIQKIKPIGAIFQYFFDAEGNLISKTDPLNHSKSYTYDGMNRLLVIVDPLGNKIEKDYDLEGNLIQFIDKNLHTYTYQYDALNRKISATDPLGFTKTYTYDAQGNLLSFTDKNLHTTDLPPGNWTIC